MGGGYCRLQMPVKRALGFRATVAGHRLGEGVPPPSIASLAIRPKAVTRQPLTLCSALHHLFSGVQRRPRAFALPHMSSHRSGSRRSLPFHPR